MRPGGRRPRPVPMRLRRERLGGKWLAWAGIVRARPAGVPLAGIGLLAIIATGSYRRWERIMFVFIVVSLLAIRERP